jgi:iron complex transport system substrate-binding protein
MMNRRMFAGAAMALAFTVAAPAILAASPDNAETKTVTDVLDRQVTIPVRAERILLGFYFEDFYAVGGPDAYGRVAAISRDAWEGWRNLQWKAYTAVDPRLEQLIDVGEVDAGTFSVEKALAARPDVAVLAEWQFNALGDVVNRLEDAGIPVVVADYNAQTVERHVASTLLLGAVLGQHDRAKALADAYAAAVADVRARVAGVTTSAPKVYVELGNRGPDELGNTYAGHMWGAMIDLAGGRNIADGQVAKWSPLSAEFVLAQDPDVILVAGSGWIGRDQAVVMGPGIDAHATHARLRPYLDRPGWQDLKAVRNGQVHALYHGGARTLYDHAYLQYIGKVLYPDAFADLDPQATLDSFFDTYLPIPARGSYMTKLP